MVSIPITTTTTTNDNNHSNCNSNMDDNSGNNDYTSRFVITEGAGAEAGPEAGEHRGHGGHEHPRVRGLYQYTVYILYSGLC